MKGPAGRDIVADRREHSPFRLRGAIAREPHVTGWMLNLNRREAAAGRYRPDIDGLRAIAVLPVVFFHYGVPGFSGGFVGVDIFFVISGYLITELIYAEMRDGRFSIMRFYERRIRRILPALFALLLVVTGVALVLLFPRDLRQYAHSLWATAIFGSNFAFWQQADYFDTAAHSKPLLHTWSLAVEEQFYLLWPAILFGIVYFSHRVSQRRALIVIGAILLLSFAESVHELRSDPTAAFYLLPSRMWELMLGAVLAVATLPRIKSRMLRNALAAAGLALIAWAVAMYDANTSFPGFAAVAPCLGAALLIYTGEANSTVPARILSTGVLVWIGLLSYSLYLWHWPLLVFARYYLDHPPGAALAAILILASVLLAWLSYLFIEQPFRARKAFFSGWRLFGMASAAMATAAAVGFAVVSTRGLPQRYPADVRQLLAAANEHEPRRAKCFNRTAEDVDGDHLCNIGDPHAAADFLLWGDSHAEALLPGVDAASAARHRAGVFASRSACPPLLGVERADVVDGKCRAFNDAVKRLIARDHIHEVILASRWAKHALGTDYGDDAEPTAFLVDDRSPDRSVAEDKAVFLRGLSRTLEFLSRAGVKVVIIGPVPEVKDEVPEALARAKMFGVSDDVRPTVHEFRQRQQFVLDALARLPQEYGATILYPHRTLCASGRCAVEKDGRALYYDSNHLSVFGAEQLTAQLESVL